MIIEPTDLPEVRLVKPRVFGDARGFLMETYHEAKFAEQGLSVRFVQDNYSQSVRDTVRGLHFQNPNGQGKLVRVVVGAIFDVAVDVRRGSPTFGRWVAVELSAESKDAVYVPPGFAHGFCVTSDVAGVAYKCTGFYDPVCEHGIQWNDPELAIPWPIRQPILSDKDRGYPTLSECGDELPSFP